MTQRPLTLNEAEFIAHAVVLELMNYDDEPMPPFNTRSPGVLESCLVEPFQTFGGKYLHRTLVKRAAVLFYLVTKNHGFENGNKRMAVVLTAVFIIVNNKWLDMDPLALYEIACEVATSDPKDREEVQRMLEDVFKEKIIDTPPEAQGA